MPPKRKGTIQNEYHETACFLCNDRRRGNDLSGGRRDHYRQRCLYHLPERRQGLQLSGTHLLRCKLHHQQHRCHLQVGSGAAVLWNGCPVLFGPGAGQNGKNFGQRAILPVFVALVLQCNWYYEKQRVKCRLPERQRKMPRRSCRRTGGETCRSADGQGKGKRIWQSGNCGG